MPIVRVARPEDFRSALDTARVARGSRVAFVPTMGALHDGHLALVREGRKLVGDDGLVSASVFVNPTQFGPNEDFARYPRDLDGDAAKLEAAGCDVLFCPEATAMYPEGERTRVRVDELTSGLCGPHRPGHFEGVATVVAKLFSLLGRAHAIFGKKDFQQLAVIRRLARDLFFPVTVVGHPIVREPSGLAMSSRNAYLSPEEHERALALSRGLRAAYGAFTAGERRARELRELVLGHVSRVADAVDYVEVAHPETLAPFADAGPVDDVTLVALACRIGKTRLIDNVVLGEDPPESLGAA